MQPAIQVALIEDDLSISQLIQIIVDGSPGFACTRVFSSVEEGVPSLLADPADIVLMDIDLPLQSGIEGARLLREGNFSGGIIMLSVHEDDERVFQSLCAGAIGYLAKGLPPVRLLSAIQEAYEGGSPMTAGIARKVVNSFQPESDTLLSKREREVLELLCEGENYRSIAESIFVSPNTVKAHIKSIYEKMQVHTRAQAVRKAIQNKMLK